MNRLLKKILLFSSPLLVLFIFAEISLRNIKSVYEKKKEAFEKKLPVIDLLILGNSHEENAIIPSILTNSGYNLSMPSQSLFYNQKILEKYLPQLRKLRTVIITIDYHSFYFIDQELSAFNNDKFFGVSKKYYDHRIATENLSYFFFVYGALPSIGYLINKPLPTILEEGFEPLPGADSSIINSRAGFIRAAAHNALAIKNNKLKASLEASLVQMIELLKIKNIQSVLVSTPVFHTYYDQLNKNILQENERITDSISVKYHVPYLNFMRSSEFEMQDFSDNDHLSKSGAIKFTNMLKKYIFE